MMNLLQKSAEVFEHDDDIKNWNDLGYVAENMYSFFTEISDKFQNLESISNSESRIVLNVKLSKG